MDLLIRFLLLVPSVFLIGVAWAGQRHDNAADTVHSAVRITVRWTIWIVIAVVVMQLMALLFID